MTELSREARDLLASLGDADGPTAKQTARMKRNLGLSLGVGGSLLFAGGAAGAVKAGAASAGTGIAAGAKLGGTGLGGLLSMFAIGAAAGVGVSATTLLVQRYASVSPAPIVATAGPRVETSPRRVPNAAHKALEPAFDDSPAAPSEVVAPKAQHSNVGPSAVDQPDSVSSPPVEPALGPEVELVISAKRELSRGRPAQALAIVERLAAEFPRGALRDERRLLKVLSLCALGQTEAARREAREFAASAPRSPLLPRLEQSCGGEAPGAPRGTGTR